MPTAQLAGRQVHIDAEGFLTEFDEWDDELAEVLADRIGIHLTEEHWKVIRFLREDFRERGETATSRRVQTAGGVPVKEQFRLFPNKPAKKAAYVAGLPKPQGCV